MGKMVYTWYMGKMVYTWYMGKMVYTCMLHNRCNIVQNYQLLQPRWAIGPLGQDPILNPGDLMGGGNKHV